MTIENAEGEKETIDSTPEHPFYVEGKGWVNASALRAGMVVWLADGTKAIIQDVWVEYLAEAVAVFNFKVEGFHTYFVGFSGVLVHNANCGNNSVTSKNQNADNGGNQDDSLDWSIVKQRTGETRVEHVQRHESNNLQKESHGVFYGDAVATIEDAWKNRSNGVIQPSGSSDVYIIPRANSGYAGGYSGQGQNLDYVTIVTESNTNRIITGFPGNASKYDP